MRQLELERFDTELAEQPPESRPLLLRPEALEAEREAARQAGFQAGMRAAAAAQDEAVARLLGRLGARLAEAQQDLEQVRANLLSGLAPLLTEIAALLLPAMARETLGPLIAERLLPPCDKALQRPLVLSLSPADRAAVERAIAALPCPPRLEEDPTLPEGEARLRLGPTEERLNLPRAVAEALALIRAHLAEELPRHG